MVGVKEPLAQSQHLGQSANGGFGFYLGNSTVYHGDGRGAVGVASQITAPFEGKHIGILLDLDSNSPGNRTLTLFTSNDGRVGSLVHRGVITRDLPHVDYRAAVSIRLPSESVSWTGYVDGEIPDNIFQLNEV